METTELLGMAFFAIAIMAALWQTAFAFGHRAGQNTERLLADRRIKGVLKSVNEQKPTRRLTYRKVDPRSVGKKRYLNSKLPGEVLA